MDRAGVEPNGRRRGSNVAHQFRIPHSAFRISYSHSSSFTSARTDSNGLNSTRVGSAGRSKAASVKGPVTLIRTHAYIVSSADPILTGTGMTKCSRSEEHTSE